MRVLCRYALLSVAVGCLPGVLYGVPHEDISGIGRGYYTVRLRNEAGAPAPRRLVLYKGKLFEGKPVGVLNDFVDYVESNDLILRFGSYLVIVYVESDPSFSAISVLDLHSNKVVETAKCDGAFEPLVLKDGIVVRLASTNVSSYPSDEMIGVSANGITSFRSNLNVVKHMKTVDRLLLFVSTSKGKRSLVTCKSSYRDALSVLRKRS